MKRKIKLLAFLLAAIWVVSSTPATAEAATPVKLSKSSVTLNITKDDKKTTYGTSTIKIKKSKGVKIKKTTYKSANKKIATVSKKGKVTAKKKGSTKITVAVKYKKGKKIYTKKLNYKVKVKNVKEDKKAQYSEQTVEVGKTISLGISGVTSCSSSNTKVATVSNDTIKGISVGTAEINISTQTMDYHVWVTVNPSTPQVIQVESISLDKSNCTMKVGDTLTVNATIYPANATDKTIVWNSFDTSVVTVSNGTLKAVKEGKAQVIASSRNGKLGICNVTVTSNSTETPIEPDNPSPEVPDISEVPSLGEYTIEGKKSQSIYYDNSDENITSKVIWRLISGDKKALSEYGSGNDGTPFSYVHVEGNIQGDVVVGAYYNNTLLATATVHVTSDNPQFVAYEEWKANMKQKLWKEDMTNKQKVAVFAGYSITLYNYYYKEHDCLFNGDRITSPYMYACSGCHTDCFGSSQMIADIADDLGLECKFIDYDGNIANHPSGIPGHIMAYVHFEDGWFEVESTPEH